jgi:branched-chain amino acid transport system ATP-binding protein
VAPGEVVAILGPNGAGKSSLLGAVAGLVSGEGSVRLGDCEIGRRSAHHRARSGLAFVPEIRGNIFGSLVVEENLQLGLRLVPPQDRDVTRARLLALFPLLAERLDTTARMLSGGEQQMLAIAIAVARKPVALLLDEPTQGLAPAVFDVLHAAFEALKNEGLALLVAEQNIAFAARICDRFVVLREGRIVMHGDRADLARKDAILAGFLGDGAGDEAGEAVSDQSFPAIAGSSGIPTVAVPT